MVRDRTRAGKRRTGSYEYEPGSWGPTEARRIVTGEPGWHDPKPERSPPC
jgi:hypothetical protein